LNTSWLISFAFFQQALIIYTHKPPSITKDLSAPPCQIATLI
jgi:hypothetical protein